MEKIDIIKSDGTVEPFREEKLLTSLRNSGSTEENAIEIVNHIKEELVDGLSTSKIYEHAYFLLKKIQTPAASRYSLKKAILDLGPSGFPFEKFVAEILKNKGFKVETGVMFRGACIEHEVDVVAVNENKFIIVEAKFHNNQGIKTDAKVPLYVNSRLEDLRKTGFDGRNNAKIKEEPWIITNTKFSSSAKRYGSCVGITMIDWNYPKGGGLKDLVEDSILHPITCLISLSDREKKVLLERGLVISRHLKENREILSELGFNSVKISKILEEINNLKR